MSGRFGAPLRVILARRGDVDLVHAELEPQVELVEGAAVEALVEASETTDLPVVGSRGLHRLRALGSVSERVAHKARPSVPVVRSRAMG